MKLTRGIAFGLIKQSDDSLKADVKDILSFGVSYPSPANLLYKIQISKEVFYILLDDGLDDTRQSIDEHLPHLSPGYERHFLTNSAIQVGRYMMSYKGKTLYIAKDTRDSIRLDVALLDEYPDLSRSSLKQLIQAGNVMADGVVQTKPSYLVKGTVKLSLERPPGAVNGDDKFTIIYQDSDVIAIDKPSGVLTHSKGIMNSEYTVADFFREYTTDGLDTNRPGIVHRLDRGTSGVIIGARHPAARRHLQAQFADRKVVKEYLAVSDKSPAEPEAVIDVPIGRNPKQPNRFMVRANGKTAETYYKVIGSTNAKAIIQLKPKTGRTHQLRVHLAHIGCPIIGDATYGGAKHSRLMLHAKSLELQLPNGEHKLLSSPVPPEFDKVG